MSTAALHDPRALRQPPIRVSVSGRLRHWSTFRASPTTDGRGFKVRFRSYNLRYDVLYLSASFLALGNCSVSAV